MFLGYYASKKFLDNFLESVSKTDLMLKKMDVAIVNLIIVEKA